MAVVVIQMTMVRPTMMLEASFSYPAVVAEQHHIQLVAAHLNILPCLEAEESCLEEDGPFQGGEELVVAVGMLLH